MSIVRMPLRTKPASFDNTCIRLRASSMAADSTTTAGMTGRMTVAQGLYRDFQIPAFLMEQRISMNHKLGHLPEIPDRMAFGAQLVGAIEKAVLDVVPARTGAAPRGP